MKTEPVNQSLGPGVVSMLFLVSCMPRPYVTTAPRRTQQ
jgi:hypothetical protein